MSSHLSLILSLSLCPICFCVHRRSFRRGIGFGESSSTGLVALHFHPFHGAEVPADVSSQGLAHEGEGGVPDEKDEVRFWWV